MPDKPDNHYHVMVYDGWSMVDHAQWKDHWVDDNRLMVVNIGQILSMLIAASEKTW